VELMSEYDTVVQSANKQQVAGQWVHSSDDGKSHAVAGDPGEVVYTSSGGRAPKGCGD
jgi:hypothetical protein